jgi:hypothetical protein
MAPVLRQSVHNVAAESKQVFVREQFTGSPEDNQEGVYGVGSKLSQPELKLGLTLPENLGIGGGGHHQKCYC